MRTILAVLVGVTLGAGGATIFARQSSLMADAATAAAVRSVKAGIVDGHRTKNRAKLDRLYAPDYTALDVRGGVRDKAALLDGLATDPEVTEGRYELRTIRRWGTIAVASGHGRMVYKNADGGVRVSEYDSVNVFERRDGRWLYVAAFLP